MGQTNDGRAGKPGRSSRATQAPRFNAARFVQYELDEEQSRQCKAWQLDDSSLLLELLALVDDGYTVTARYDTFSDAYACWVQVRGDDSHVNNGLILSGRGSTPAKAIKQAIFKHRAMDGDCRANSERVRPENDD